jgi:hypothetical protein
MGGAVGCQGKQLRGSVDKRIYFGSVCDLTSRDVFTDAVVGENLIDPLRLMQRASVVKLMHKQANLVA